MWILADFRKFTTHTSPNPDPQGRGGIRLAGGEAQAQVRSSLSKAPLCKNTQQHPKSALQKALVSKDHARTWAWATVL